jgi:hypothetical protein
LRSKIKRPGAGANDTSLTRKSAIVDYEVELRSVIVEQSENRFEAYLRHRDDMERRRQSSETRRFEAMAADDRVAAEILEQVKSAKYEDDRRRFIERYNTAVAAAGSSP